MRSKSVAVDTMSSGLKAVHAYWDSLRNGKFAPAWRDVDLMSFPHELLPTTMIVNVHVPLEKSIFRFWGSKLTEIHGEDMTSRCPYDLQPPEFGRKLYADHKELIEQRRPLAWHYSFLAAGGYMHSHAIVRLPLSDDGEHVTHIVVVVDFSREALDLMKSAQETFGGIVSGGPDEPAA